MADILDEAINELKEEKAHQLLNKYGKIGLLLACSVFILWMLYLGYSKFQENKIYALGSEYMIANLRMQAHNLDQAMQAMEKASNGDVAYSALAAIEHAAALVVKQQNVKAAEVYRKIYESKAFDQVFKDYAKLMSIIVSLNANLLKVSEAVDDLDEYIRQKPIFKFSAIEQRAVLLISMQKMLEAKNSLNEIITSTSAPKALRKRAQELLVLTEL